MRVLIVEDDLATSAHIANSLASEFSSIDSVASGERGLSSALDGKYDLLIIDRMLPNMDGLTVIKKLRSCGCEIPVLMVSALGETDDRVAGLEAGADDYLAKPFAIVELRARLAALSRRSRMSDTPTLLRLADMELDRIARTARRAGSFIELQPREFRLLEYLMIHSGRVVTRSMLLEQVWEFHFDPKTTIVETYISRLRAKINANAGPDLLHNVRGVGYCLRDH